MTALSLRHTALSLGTLLFSTQAGNLVHATGAQQILYAVDQPGVTGDGSEATPWTSASGTGGIQEAIDSCGRGSSTQGCTVVLPRGVVHVTSTIRIGVKLAEFPSPPGIPNPKAGLVVRGHGNGARTIPGNFHTGGTTLRWDVTDAQPVMRIFGVSWSVFEGFTIDGGGYATIGIDYTANSDNGSWGSSQQNIFESILVERVTDAAINVGPRPGTDCECQVSETTWRMVSTRDVPVAFRQDGAQTTGQRIEDSDLTCTDRCVELYDGDVYMHNNFIGNRFTNNPRADIWISKDMNDVLLVGNVHESCARAIIESEPGYRFFSTTMIQNRLQHFRCPGDMTNTLCVAGYCYIIDHNQSGPFNMLGGEYSHSKGDLLPQGEKPRFRFVSSTPERGRLHVNTYGNAFASSVRWDALAANNAYIHTTDLLPGGQFQSMYWGTQNVGLGSEYPLVIANTNLDAGTETVAWITQQGKLRLFKATSQIDFGDPATPNVLSVAPPPTVRGSNTISLPNASGTVVLTTPSTVTGTVRLANNSGVSSRNSADTADVNVAKLNASDQLELSDSSHIVAVPSTASGGGLKLGQNGNIVKQMFCGNVTFPAASATSGHSQLSTIVSNLPTHAACVCSPRSNFSTDKSVVYEFCYAAPTTLRVKLDNTSNDSLPTSSTIVDYCCFDK